VFDHEQLQVYRESPVPQGGIAWLEPLAEKF
jgi:hypothetical protein